MYKAIYHGLRRHVALLLAAGADVNMKVDNKTPLYYAVIMGKLRRMGGMLLRAGAPLQSILSVERFWGNDRYPYLQKIKSAGGFKQYEAQVKKSLAATLVPKFPQIPAEVIPTVVEFWAHAGDY